METTTIETRTTRRSDYASDREIQKDRELERLRAEMLSLTAHVVECHDALHQAHKAIHGLFRGEGKDALIEVLTGWPPRLENEIVHAPEGTVLGKGAWIIRRRGA